MFRNDSFTITDATGQPYFVLAAAPSLSGSRTLLDVYKAPVLQMQRKMPSLRGTWLMNRAPDGVRVASVRPAFGFSPSRSPRHSLCHWQCSVSTHKGNHARLSVAVRRSDNAYLLAVNGPDQLKHPSNCWPRPPVSPDCQLVCCVHAAAIKVFLNDGDEEADFLVEVGGGGSGKRPLQWWRVRILQRPAGLLPCI